MLLVTIPTRVLSSLRTYQQTQIKTVESTKQKVLRHVNSQMCAVMGASLRGFSGRVWRKLKKMEEARREGSTLIEGTSVTKDTVYARNYLAGSWSQSSQTEPRCVTAAGSGAPGAEDQVPVSL